MIDKFKTLIELIEVDYNKYLNGNQSAGRRVRAKLRQFKPLVAELKASIPVGGAKEEE